MITLCLSLPRISYLFPKVDTNPSTEIFSNLFALDPCTFLYYRKLLSSQAGLAVEDYFLYQSGSLGLGAKLF